MNERYEDNEEIVAQLDSHIAENAEIIKKMQDMIEKFEPNYTNEIKNIHNEKLDYTLELLERDSNYLALYKEMKKDAMFISTQMVYDRHITELIKEINKSHIEYLRNPDE